MEDTITVSKEALHEAITTVLHQMVDDAYDVASDIVTLVEIMVSEDNTPQLISNEEFDEAKIYE